MELRLSERPAFLGRTKGERKETRKGGIGWKECETNEGERKTGREGGGGGRGGGVWGGKVRDRARKG